MSENDYGPASDTTRLSEEIRLLVELVVERAAPWLDGVIAAGHGSEDAGHAAAGGNDDGDTDAAARCSWCPLCAIVAVVRGERPEVVARVLEQAAQLIALLRAVLADRWEPEHGLHMPGFRPDRDQPANHPEAPQPGPAAEAHTGRRVQHIPVRRRDGRTPPAPAGER